MPFVVVERVGKVYQPDGKASAVRVLEDVSTEIQEGEFAREWMLENKVNKPRFNALRRKGNEHQIEEVGARLRSMMAWIGKSKIVDKSKN